MDLCRYVNFGGKEWSHSGFKVGAMGFHSGTLAVIFLSRPSVLDYLKVLLTDCRESHGYDNSHSPE